MSSVQFKDHPGYEAIMQELPRIYLASLRWRNHVKNVNPDTIIGGLICIYDDLLENAALKPLDTNIEVPCIDAARDFTLAARVLEELLRSEHPGNYTHLMDVFTLPLLFMFGISTSDTSSFIPRQHIAYFTGKARQGHKKSLREAFQAHLRPCQECPLRGRAQ